MRIRRSLTAALAAVMAVATAGIATAHAPDIGDGHVAANTNYGIRPVGYSPLEGIQDGRYTDVWAHKGFAYVGSFQDPSCSNDGVYIADIRKPDAPKYLGQIHSAPGTRVNDVKVIEVDGRDVLIASHEVCGTDVAQTRANERAIEEAEVHTPLTDGEGNVIGSAVGQGSDGISLYDVTRPRSPRKIVTGFLDTEVHNTFPWTAGDRTFLLVVDDFNANDTWIVELTDPDNPKLLLKTGLEDWLGDPDIDLGDQLAFGSFPFPLLHDVWVEYNDSAGRWEAVLSYWDAGFITLDVSNPEQPVFLGHSDYPEVDPILGEERKELFPSSEAPGALGAPEGNAHAAVFGGEDNEFIFGGDEDFDASVATITVGTGDPIAASNGSRTPPPPQAGQSGTLRFVGLACGETIPQAVVADGETASTDIALIERGACAFTTKASQVTAAGYSAGIVFNRSGDDVTCGTGISMLVDGRIPMVSITRDQGFDLLGAGPCEDDDETSLSVDEDGNPTSLIGTETEDVTLENDYVGWGYFWALNNVDDPEPMTVQGSLDGPGGTTDVGYLGTVGYYAPAEVADPALASGAGDLSMHNLETDILPGYRNRTFISWYSLGMRVVEFREGHFHDGSTNGDFYSWNIHEVGRWIAGDPERDPGSHLQLAHFAAQHRGVGVEDLTGSNFWGVTQTMIDGERYILGSDRNTGLWIFEYECDADPDGSDPLYCGEGNQDG